MSRKTCELTHGVWLSVQQAKQTAAAATWLGRYGRNVSPSTSVVSHRYCKSVGKSSMLIQCNNCRSHYPVSLTGFVGFRKMAKSHLPLLKSRWHPSQCSPTHPGIFHRRCWLWGRPHWKTELWAPSVPYGVSASMSTRTLLNIHTNKKRKRLMPCRTYVLATIHSSKVYLFFCIRVIGDVDKLFHLRRVDFLIFSVQTKQKNIAVGLEFEL